MIEITGQFAPDQSQIANAQNAIQFIISNPGLAQKAIDNPALISVGLTGANIFSAPDPNAEKDYTGLWILAGIVFFIGFLIGRKK